MKRKYSETLTPQRAGTLRNDWLKESTVEKKRWLFSSTRQIQNLRKNEQGSEFAAYLKLETSDEMKIPKEGIEEYRNLVRKQCSISITDAQAEEQFADLLALFRVIYQPIKTFDRDRHSPYNENGNTDE